ncbi:hypothetical protein C8R45DRAFT_1112736 [Mycena sanguinolenta]|nr:hypothetical protein C8R45DRAFT_1112736 [Mycena sanguinolenta]
MKTATRHSYVLPHQRAPPHYFLAHWASHRRARRRSALTHIGSGYANAPRLLAVHSDNHALIMTASSVAFIYKLHRANLCVAAAEYHCTTIPRSLPSRPRLHESHRPPTSLDARAAVASCLVVRPRCLPALATPINVERRAHAAICNTGYKYLQSLPTLALFTASMPPESLPARIADGEHLAPGAICAAVP